MAGGRASRLPERGTRPPHALPCSSASAPPGRQLESVRAEAAEKGDVGLVAESSRSSQRLVLPPPTLTAAGVFARFRDIARLTGSAVSGAGGSPGTPGPLLFAWGPQSVPAACQLGLDFWGLGRLGAPRGQVSFPSSHLRLWEPPLDILAFHRVPTV